MKNITAAINDTVPISLFNRGFAGKIFEEVKRTGAKVVMKNNTAECILLSPAEYEAIMEQLEDDYLIALAEERLAHYDPEKTITLEELDRECGITHEMIEAAEEVEFE